MAAVCSTANFSKTGSVSVSVLFDDGGVVENDTVTFSVVSDPVIWNVHPLKSFAR